VYDFYNNNNNNNKIPLGPVPRNFLVTSLTSS